MTSLEKIRESIDAVVASVMRSHADQLRNEVSEHVRVHLEEDAKALIAVESQLREKTEHAQTLEQQLASTRNEITDKQKHIETIEQQLRSFETESAQLRSRVGEVEGTLSAETEKLNKQNKELEQLLEMSQDEVKQLQQREDEQKKSLQQHQSEAEKLRAEMQEALKKQEEDHKKAIEAKEREHADKSADLEKQIESHKAAAVSVETLKAEHTQALAAKEQELKEQIAEIEQRLEKVQSEALEQVQGKEKELLEQVHLLEELLVQGQHAREQQLEAKDRDLQEKLDAQKAEHETKIAEIQAQLADRDKLLHAQGGELQQRAEALQKELESTRLELKDTHAAFEQAQKQLDEANAALAKREEEFKTQLSARHEAETSLKQELEKQTAAHQELLAAHSSASAQKSDLEGMQGLWEQREKELAAQLADSEKRLGEYANAEKSWHEREQELLSHRDKVLSSSAEASSASQQALVAAQEEQVRLQAQLDGILETLGNVREELKHAHESHQARERDLTEELANLRTAIATQGAAAPTNVVSISDAPAGKVSSEDQSAAVHDATERIHAARTQSEILKALLEGATPFSGRSGILVVHGRTATGWAGRGFGSDAEFRRLSVECAKGLAGRVVQSRKYASGQAKEFDQKLVQSFGAPQDGHAHVFPLVVRDRVAAFFYADCGAEEVQDVNSQAIETVVRAAGAWLDELAGNKVTPKAGADVLPTPMASSSTAPAEPQPVAVMAAFAGGATTAVAPPPANGDNTEAARLRARRFAKLLVDEIKLYNKDAVEQGRRNSDLYDRLRESIDKSRASYDKRWGKTISDVDYFREELVRNLAENDVAVLGSNFPR